MRYKNRKYLRFTEMVDELTEEAIRYSMCVRNGGRERNENMR